MAFVQHIIPFAGTHAQLSSSSPWRQTPSWKRDYIQSRGQLSRSVWCLGTGPPSPEDVSPSPLRGRKVTAEKIWRRFFADPSQWWDHRSEKENPRYPDFKHKSRKQSLWLNDNLTPPWVEAELASMTAGSIQCSIFSWNLKLRRYVRAGDYKKAIKIFGLIQEQGMNPDKFTFLPVLNACSSLRSLEEGRRVHEQIVKTGFEGDIFVGTCLVDMYAKCGSIEDGRRVFNRLPSRDVVSWTAMIGGYVKCGEAHKALGLSRQMYAEGVEPDPTTFVGLLNACASIAALEEGRLVHEQISRKGYESNAFVSSSLVDMYAKCGSIEDARRVFNKMPLRNGVSWTAMILGYVKCGEAQEALELSGQMFDLGITADHTTFVAVLNACASVAALGEGRLVHEQITLRGYESDIFVGNSLIDMYAKCGSIEDARIIFNRMPARDVVSWNAMLAGYAMHGRAQEALEHFECMSEEDVEVNGVTFVCLLSACSHGGLAEEGLHYFQSMSVVYNVPPTMEHYACAVNLLGRAGHLHKAEDLIKSLPSEPDANLWMSLLAACRIHGNVDIGERVAKRVLELQPGNAACYVLLLNIYAGAGKWDRVQAVHNARLERDVKGQGRSWIEVDNKVHSFVVNDGNHLQIAKVHLELELLSLQMQEAGYVAKTSFVASENFLDRLKARNMPVTRSPCILHTKNKRDFICVTEAKFGHRY